MVERKIARYSSMLALPLATLWLNLPAPAWAESGANAYATEGSIDEYLMADRNAEIALARSAAPAAIADHATVLVLGRHGYETAVKGDNGFVCVVERSWMAQFDWPEFWNPRVRGPVCFNPAAVRSILPITIKRTEMALAAKSKGEMVNALKAAYDQRSLPALEPGAMCYMMSRNQYLGDSAGSWRPHLMFYVPKTDSSFWGADLRYSPVLLNPQFHDSAEPVTVYMVPVWEWSDGGAAPAHEHAH
jgi:hypothetical protein